MSIELHGAAGSLKLKHSARAAAAISALSPWQIRNLAAAPQTEPAGQIPFPLRQRLSRVPCLLCLWATKLAHRQIGMWTRRKQDLITCSRRPSLAVCHSPQFRGIMTALHATARATEW